MLKRKFSENYFYCIVLGAIFFIALALRVYQLTSFPAGFHLDEASLGYNGYSLLLTGKDENNNAFPLYIDMFGDHRPSGYHFLTTVPIKLFGLNEFSVRFPAAFFGSISVFAMYFLTSIFIKDKRISLFSAFLLSISPWHIVLSRASGEAVVALFFVMVGFSFLIKSLQNNKKLFVFIGSIFLVASFLFYHTPRIFAPMLIVSIIMFSSLLQKRNAVYKFNLIFAFIFVSVIAFMLVFVVPGGTGRFNQVNIFNFPQTKLIMNEQIREDGVAENSILMTRFFHNKLINYPLTFLDNYFDYFSADFLFINGGLPNWYSVPKMGLIYLIELPFIIIGGILLLIQKNMISKIPLIWFFLAPLIAAITVDDIPNINRSIVMLPAIELFAAYGIYRFFQYIPYKFRLTFFFVIAVFFNYSIGYFIHQYFFHAPIHKNWYRNEGAGEVIKTIKNSYKDFDTVVITKSTGGIYPLILFYMGYDPKLYQESGSPKDREYMGFGKFFFVPQQCPSEQKDDRFPRHNKIIYVDRGDCEQTNIDQKIIYRKDGTKAFRLAYE